MKLAITQQKSKMSYSQKVALFCGFFCFNCYCNSINWWFLFYDTNGLFFKKNLTDAEKLVLRKSVGLWSLRFTFLTIYINAFMVSTLVNFMPSIRNIKHLQEDY